MLIRRKKLCAQTVLEYILLTAAAVIAIAGFGKFFNIIVGDSGALTRHFNVMKQSITGQ
ncbi:MAG: hypothetical protein GY858_06055 [Candidatus Omnitrophica bacterium]|nr:hypothetical protein [Candidatus Omnitrophota bacterium]